MPFKSGLQGQIAIVQPQTPGTDEISLFGSEAFAAEFFRNVTLFALGGTRNVLAGLAGYLYQHIDFAETLASLVSPRIVSTNAGGSTGFDVGMAMFESVSTVADPTGWRVSTSFYLPFPVKFNPQPGSPGNVVLTLEPLLSAAITRTVRYSVNLALTQTD